MSTTMKPVNHARMADARWSPSGYDIAGSSRPAWVPVVGLVFAVALLVGFYSVVDGAVRRADQAHRDAQGPTAVSAAVALHASI